ncbi:glycosyltransferase family 2 protein [Hydrogenimonas sp. SS33]|uniref:glycosyltransferase family 2 protein n=1 Tax=Hydrogenimonas leucolamina TaxID=2954236 RepID=UPI00336C2617
MVDLTVVILTLNEEKNLPFALENVIGWAKNVYVLDSGSTDKTVEIAEEMGARVFYRKFDTYARQRNYAIKELPIDTEWMMFLDADEYILPELKQEIAEKLAEHPKENGFYLRRRFYFMGRWIRHGGYYPVKLLRLFRREKAEVVRDINEQIVVEGETATLRHDFADENRKGIYDWIEKHNRYSSFEAQELLNYDKRRSEREKDDYAKLFGTQPQRKRWIKENIRNRFVPPLARPFVYFSYRYFLKLGFLDGKEGFIYFMMHAFIMGLATNVKYLELKREEEASQSRKPQDTMQ